MAILAAIIAVVMYLIVKTVNNKTGNQGYVGEATGCALIGWIMFGLFMVVAVAAVFIFMALLPIILPFLFVVGIAVALWWFTRTPKAATVNQHTANQHAEPAHVEPVSILPICNLEFNNETLQKLLRVNISLHGDLYSVNLAYLHYSEKATGKLGMASIQPDYKHAITVCQQNYTAGTKVGIYLLVDGFIAKLNEHGDCGFTPDEVRDRIAKECTFPS